VYTQAAQQLGRELVARNISLVYGGARVGLMGTLADTVLAAGGKVTGIFPLNIWSEEENHTALTTTYIVKSLHERKQMMEALADGFIALPGGLGTFDELAEIVEWSHLGLHSKPIGLLNVANYFSPFLRLINHAVDEGFLAHRPALHIDDQVASLVDTLSRGYGHHQREEAYAVVLDR
jgi:uncharacterized protein (TIGR00730 family)